MTHSICISIVVGVIAGAVTAWVILFFAYRTALKNANKTWIENDKKMKDALNLAYQQGAIDLQSKLQTQIKTITASDSQTPGLPFAKEKQTEQHQRPVLQKSRRPKK